MTVAAQVPCSSIEQYRSAVLLNRAVQARARPDLRGSGSTRRLKLKTTPANETPCVRDMHREGLQLALELSSDRLTSSGVFVDTNRRSFGCAHKHTHSHRRRSSSRPTEMCTRQ